MDFTEHPLFSRPALMLSVLKTASRGDVTLADCLARVNEDLARAKEPGPIDVPELLAHLDEIRHALIEAAALAARQADRFTATERGRALLAKYPMGIDDTVLGSVDIHLRARMAAAR
jgi:hypothetical protein